MSPTHDAGEVSSDILLSCLDESMNFKRFVKLLHGLFAAQSQFSCYNRDWRWDRRCCRRCNQLLTVFSLHFRKRALSSWTCPRLIMHHTILSMPFLCFALHLSHLQVKRTRSLHATTDKLSRHKYTLPCLMGGGSYDAVDTIDVQAPCWVATRQCGGYSR